MILILPTPAAKKFLKHVTLNTGRISRPDYYFRKMGRLSVRDVVRALGMSYSQGDRLAKMIPFGKQGFNMTIAQALEESAQLKFAYQTEPETKKVLDVARRLEGLPRHSSVHAAGVVIADKSLTDYVPLQRDSKEGKIITQYDMYCLDLNAVSNQKAIGLLKVDFLGLRNLTIIEEALKYVEKNSGEKIDIHHVPIDDKRPMILFPGRHRQRLSAGRAE
jgi:DNA polymerase-3 subunit alpha